MRQQGPPANIAPLGAGISSSRNAQTYEKVQRESPLKNMTTHQGKGRDEAPIHSNIEVRT